VAEAADNTESIMVGSSAQPNFKHSPPDSIVSKDVRPTPSFFVEEALKRPIDELPKQNLGRPGQEEGKASDLVGDMSTELQGGASEMPTHEVHYLENSNPSPSPSP